MKIKFLLIALVFGFLSCSTLSALESDPMKVGPDIYKLKFENERVRVMEVVFVPGAKIAMHSHPDHVTTLITAGTLRLSYPDGTTKEISGNAGDVFYIPAESHAAENIGTTEVKGIVVELKEAKPMTE